MKVFVSHASADIELAKRLVESLRSTGLSVWFDLEEVFPGDNWALEIGKALEASDAMVVLLTPEADRSANVQFDIGYAIGNRKFKGKLIPLIPEEAESGVGHYPWMHAVQIVHFRRGRVEEGAAQVALILQQAA